MPIGELRRSPFPPPAFLTRVSTFIIGSILKHTLSSLSFGRLLSRSTADPTISPPIAGSAKLIIGHQARHKRTPTASSSTTQPIPQSSV
jgi:hypothetical protein